MMADKPIEGRRDGKFFKTRNDSSEEASDRKEASHREQIVSSPHLGHAHSCKAGPAH